MTKVRRYPAPANNFIEIAEVGPTLSVLVNGVMRHSDTVSLNRQDVATLYAYLHQWLSEQEEKELCRAMKDNV